MGTDKKAVLLVQAFRGKNQDRELDLGVCPFVFGILML